MTRPTEPGWYWYKDDGTRYTEPQQWQPAEVSKYGNDYLWVRLFWGCCEDSLFRVNGLSGMWGSKIEPPN